MFSLSQEIKFQISQSARKELKQTWKKSLSKKGKLRPFFTFGLSKQGRKTGKELKVDSEDKLNKKSSQKSYITVDEINSDIEIKMSKAFKTENNFTMVKNVSSINRLAKQGRMEIKIQSKVQLHDKLSHQSNSDIKVKMNTENDNTVVENANSVHEAEWRIPRNYIKKHKFKIATSNSRDDIFNTSNVFSTLLNKKENIIDEYVDHDESSIDWKQDKKIHKSIRKRKKNRSCKLNWQNSKVKNINKISGGLKLSSEHFNIYSVLECEEIDNDEFVECDKGYYIKDVNKKI